METKKKVVKTKKYPKSRSLQPSNIKKKRPVRVIDTYRDFRQALTVPVTQSTIEAIAKQYIEWAEQDDSLIISKFPLSISMLPKVLYDWIHKYPPMAAAHEVALAMVASRREEGGLKNKLNTAIVMSQQARYDPNWWALESKRAEQRASLQEKGDRNIVFKIVQEPVEEVKT